MTTDELRDWHAREDGWLFGKTETCTFDHWHNADGEPYLDAESEYVHPYPPTLDGAASAMPEGWTWMCQGTRWFAWPETNGGFVRAEVGVARTNDEIHDRYLLAKLAKEAMKNGTLENNTPQG